MHLQYVGVLNFMPVLFLISVSIIWIYVIWIDLYSESCSYGHAANCFVW